MSTGLDAALLDRFRALIARRLGLHFDGGKAAFLADLLRRGMSEGERDGACYVDRLTLAGAADPEWRTLAHALTVTETYFFRNIAQFSALREFVVSEWLPSRLPPRRLRILSAGCASGEEPYSIAMLLRDAPDCQAAIHGIDVNTAMLFKAATGRYSAWSLRETSEEMRARYFTPRGNECVLDAEIRQAVTFEERYLNEEDAGFWRPESFDIVFCRNALMYFTPAAARATIARIARSLAPGGLLFLGHAETLRGLSRDFHLRHTHGTFYYQRKDELETPDVVEEIADPVWAMLPPASDGAAPGPAWYAVIESAAERVRSLAARPAVRSDVASAAGRDDPLTRAIALLDGERHAEALSVLNGMPGEAARQSDAMFLRAVLLLNSGDLAGAERLCQALTMRDGVSAGVHYVMALCREAGGDTHAAAAHDRHAAALDPEFAMPRLHLGLLARRVGDQGAARRELTHASALLPDEHAERVLLFGGGFGREALLALCQAELASAGGAP